MACTHLVFRHHDSFRHYKGHVGAKSQSRGVYVFAHILDVRYNDDHTGQALLDHTLISILTALTGLCGNPLALEEL